MPSVWVPLNRQFDDRTSISGGQHTILRFPPVSLKGVRPVLCAIDGWQVIELYERGSVLWLLISGRPSFDRNCAGIDERNRKIVARPPEASGSAWCTPKTLTTRTADKGPPPWRRLHRPAPRHGHVMTAHILPSRRSQRARATDAMTRLPRQAIVHLTVTVVRHLPLDSTVSADRREAS